MMHYFRLALTVILFFWAKPLFADKELTVLTASWCAPCQQFKQDVMDEPEILLDTPVHIMDFDRSQEYARDNNVKTVPTFILHEIDKTGKERELGRKVGYRSKREFREWLRGLKAAAGSQQP